MHSLLEDYLARVAAQLSPLPAKRRDEELREMRAHLENAVIVNREMGQTENEAAQTAVAQFGTPQDLGENVVWAWRRGEQRQKQGFWGAAACALALSFLLSNTSLSETSLDAPVRNAIVLLGNSAHLWGAVSPMSPSLISGVMLHSLVGGLCGLIFPKRALAGAMLGAAAWYGISLAILLVVVSAEGLSDSPYWSRWIPLEYTTSTLSALGAVWAVSRARLAWKRRGRLARGWGSNSDAHLT